MDEILSRDQNRVTVLAGITDNANQSITMLRVDPLTKRLKISGTISGGTGTVTTVSIVTANGFAGSVATPTTTPAITISTTVTGILKGNGTSISAATAGTDYVTDSSTNTFTNKTYDTAGTGNSFSINGVSVTANTGTGAVVRANTPTLITPVLGIASATSLGVSGIITTGLNGGTNGSITFSGSTSGSTVLQASVAAGGTITLPNGTGTVALTSNNLSVFAATTSAQLLGVISDETGSGSLVFGTTPTFTTSALFTTGFVMNWASSNVVLTHSSGILTLGTGDFRISNVGSNSASVVTNGGTATLSSKRISKRITTTNAPGATPTINSDSLDIAQFTGLATAITSMTTNLTGTPLDGDFMEVMFLDNATARAITWGASFANGGLVNLPTTTVISTMLRVLLQYQTQASLNKWVCVAVA